MYGQHAPQTQNDRTSSFIRSVKRHVGVRAVAFGAIILVSGQLLLPNSALAAETPEPDAATPITRSEANTDGNFTATTVVDHNYDLELLLPSCWSRMRRLYTTSPTNPRISVTA